MANPEDLGRYRLKRLLGRGALGEVWEAADLGGHGAKVAVKIMHAADDELALARAQFAREARLASLMRHPNVVAVHDAGEAAGTSFMVMDMVDGKSLRAALRDPSTITSDKLRWLRQVGEGLAAMHRVGLVHRDVKPENVIVRADGSACIVDLGIAKWIKFDLGGELDPENAIEDAAAHTAPSSKYAPPETLSLELYDELGDQFAFGVVAYELLTGALPSDDSEPLTKRDDVPEATAAALDRARSKERDLRWDAMDLLLDELEPAREDEGGPSEKEGGESLPPKTDSRSPPDETAIVREDVSRSRVSPLVMVGAVLLVLVLVGILAIALR